MEVSLPPPRKGQKVCLIVRAAPLLRLILVAIMRPRTRLLRLMSQELALKLTIFFYFSGCAACARQRLRVIRDGSANVASDSFFRFERDNTCVPIGAGNCV